MVFAPSCAALQKLYNIDHRTYDKIYAVVSPNIRWIIIIQQIVIKIIMMMKMMLMLMEILLFDGEKCCILFN